VSMEVEADAAAAEKAKEKEAKEKEEEEEKAKEKEAKEKEAKEKEEEEEKEDGDGGGGGGGVPADYNPVADLEDGTIGLQTPPALTAEEAVVHQTAPDSLPESLPGSLTDSQLDRAILGSKAGPPTPNQHAVARHALAMENHMLVTEETEAACAATLELPEIAGEDLPATVIPGGANDMLRPRPHGP